MSRVVLASGLRRRGQDGDETHCRPDSAAPAGVSCASWKRACFYHRKHWLKREMKRVGWLKFCRGESLEILIMWFGIGLLAEACNDDDDDSSLGLQWVAMLLDAKVAGQRSFAATMPQ